jgi:TPP-dependent pyruvate/acetoin dehydrogenase alpha subunit
MYDAELYRTKDEVAQWKQRDPIALFQQRLRTAGYLTDNDLDSMETTIATEIAEAVAFAETGPWEPLEDLTKDVYTPTKSIG